MGKIPDDKLGKVKNLYYRDRLGMLEIAKRLNVSIDAVVYFMRRHNLERRNFFEVNKLRFDKKIPSFKIRPVNSAHKKQLRIIGTTLYWCEGYKSEKSTFVDFTNSDPEIILIFLNFLRNIYEIDENKLRVLLYCYSNQNVKGLVRFWSNLTKIPAGQFTRPYIRKDFRENGRKMKYGLVHIRYFDKKLLIAIKDLINLNKKKFAQVVP